MPKGGKSIIITNNDHPKGPRKDTFTYDFCYWSHNGYQVGEDGYASADDTSSPYADQVKLCS